MSSALQTRLPELAAQINHQHELCEAGYRTALTHALRAGELLEDAKSQLPHGDWLHWLGAHTTLSARCAQQYMQLASAPNAQALSHLGIEEALKTIAEPQSKAAGGELRSALRDVDEADARAALAELGPLPERDVFPASGMERTTWRQIRESLSRVERAMGEGSADGLSKWSRREALGEASRHARAAASQLSELADSLAS